MPLAVDTANDLVQGFYQNMPGRVHFSGCSNGGRLAMMAAQRHPKLFDGIAGGGGIFDLTGNAGVHGLWLLQSTRDENGDAVIDRLQYSSRVVFGQFDRDEAVERLNPKACVANALEDLFYGKKPGGREVLVSSFFCVKFPRDLCGMWRQMVSRFRPAKEQDCCARYLAAPRQFGLVEELLNTPLGGLAL